MTDGNVTTPEALTKAAEMIAAVKTVESLYKGVIKAVKRGQSGLAAHLTDELEAAMARVPK